MVYDGLRVTISSNVIEVGLRLAVHTTAKTNNVVKVIKVRFIFSV
jgi:hypothetical protein